MGGAAMAPIAGLVRARSAPVGMVDAHGLLGADDLDFGLTPNAGVSVDASSFSPTDLFSTGAVGFATTASVATLTSELGSSQDIRRRYAAVSAQHTKRAKAEERAKRIALKKRLLELENLTSTLAERVERVAEERDALSLTAQRATAKVQELDAKRKASAVSRSISQLRQKIGAKPDLQHGFDALRYRSLLEVVHKQCLTGVRQLISHKWGFPFAAPVDPEALGLPTYRDVIKNPMDLGTIKKLIEDGGKYLVSEDVDADVRLTFSNAMTFNKEGTDVHTMAKGLLEEWDVKWSAIQQRIEDVEACVLVEREVAIARNDAAARRADAALKETERSNTSAALDVATTQLAEVESQMLAIMRPLSHDDRVGLTTSLKRLPSSLREGAEQIIARHSGGGWDAASVRLENINDHSDLTLHLLVRYAKNMNRNRIAVIAGWCGHTQPEELLEKFKEEAPVEYDDLATFVAAAPKQHHADEHLSLRSIDVIPEEYDFDPLAFDDLLGDVPDDQMDFDPLAL
jgi:cell division protein FtsB